MHKSGIQSQLAPLLNKEQKKIVDVAISTVLIFEPEIYNKEGFFQF